MIWFFRLRTTIRTKNTNANNATTNPAQSDAKSAPYAQAPSNPAPNQWQGSVSIAMKAIIEPTTKLAINDDRFNRNVRIPYSRGLSSRGHDT